MDLENIKVRFVGKMTLLQHNVRLADPLNEFARASKKITDKGSAKRTEADHEALRRIEWEGGLYHDEKIGPYVPDTWIEGMFVETARPDKGGKRKAESGIFSGMDKIPIEYDGPRDIEGMWAEGWRFVDRRGAGVRDSKVQRTRPRFRDWALTFFVQFQPEVVDRSTVIDWMKKASYLVGLGDYRPKFGRFEVELLK